MRISCPYCGERDLEEFSIQGEAAGTRPQSDSLADFHAYVNLRDNVLGPALEHWYHTSGCRRWLVVRRDTSDHTVLGVEFAKP